MRLNNKLLFAVSLSLLVISSNGTMQVDAIKKAKVTWETDAQIDVQPDPGIKNKYKMGGNSSARFNNYQSNKKESLAPNSIGVGNVKASTLNVRSGPSTSDTVIGTLKNGDKVDIYGKENSWYKISFNDSYGYVSSDYIKLSPIEKGIDVSKWNDTVDWNKVKADGIDYVIIRGGYGTSTVDPKFEEYMNGALDAGLKVGVYWFSYATSPQKAIEEANKCLQVMEPYKSKISYPVFFDYEYDSVDYANKQGVTVTKELATKMAENFLSTVEASGYITGLYTNKDFGDRYFSTDLLYDSNLWVAQYSSECTYPRPYMMWQCTDKGTINGIGTSTNPVYFDMNYTYLKPYTKSTTVQKDLSNAKIDEIPSTIYTGEEITPTVNVTYDDEILTLNKDYKLEYSNNTNIGKANIEIEGIGDYKGSIKSTFNIVPEGIKNLAIEESNDDSITLTWDKIDDITAYRVYLYNENEKQYERIATVSGEDNNTYTHTNLSKGTVYRYKVRAYKTVNNENLFGGYSVGVSGATTLCAPKDLKQNVSTDETIEISWSQVENASGYEIYRYNSDTKEYMSVGNVEGNKTSYLDTDLDVETKYSYKIKSYIMIDGKKYLSDYSDELECMTKNVDLQQVENLRVVSSGEDYIELSWDKISDATAYRVYEYNSTEKQYERIATISGADNNTYKHTQLPSGTDKRYKVRAFKTIKGKNYFGGYSSALVGVTNLSTTNNLKVVSSGEDYIKLSWDKVNNATAYRVYKYDTTEKTYKRLATIPATENYYIDKGLAKGSSNRYKVRAYKTVSNKNYFGGYSSGVYGVINPSEPENLKEEKVTDETIEISWSKVENATGYKIYRYDSDIEEYTNIGTVNGNSKLNYTDNKVDPYKTYLYRVKSYVLVDGQEYISGYSDLVKCMTKAVNVPQVKNLKAESIGNNYIKLSWDKLSDVTAYRVYKYDSKEETFKRLATISGCDNNYYTDENLESGTSNIYMVRAYKTINNNNYFGKYTDKLNVVTNSIDK